MSVTKIEGDKINEKAIVSKVVKIHGAKILIGVPILAWSNEFATSFLKFWTELMLHQEKAEGGRKFSIGYEFTYRQPTALAEIHFVETAIAAGCSHVLLMDDDIYDVTVEDLLKLLDADKDVIGGIMHSSGFPYSMCAFRRYDTSTKLADQPGMKGPLRLYEVPIPQRVGVQPVDLIPFAFTLIKTSVFEKIQRPWFVNAPDAPTDSLFADLVLGAKLEYFAHFGVYLNHRGITVHNRALWHQMGLIDAQQKDSTRLVIMEPEELKKHELFMTQKMEAAEVKRLAALTTEITFHQKGA